MKKTAIIMLVMAMVAGLFATPMSAKASGHSGHGYFCDWLAELENVGNDSILWKEVDRIGRDFHIEAVLDGQLTPIYGNPNSTYMYIMYLRSHDWEYKKIIVYGYKDGFNGFIPVSGGEVKMKYVELEDIVSDPNWLPDTMFNPDNWES